MLVENDKYYKEFYDKEIKDKYDVSYEVFTKMMGEMFEFYRDKMKSDKIPDLLLNGFVRFKQSMFFTKLVMRKMYNNKKYGKVSKFGYNQWEKKFKKICKRRGWNYDDMLQEGLSKLKKFEI